MMTAKTLPKEIIHVIPPTIVTMNRRFAIIAGTWVEVDDSVTLEMLRERWISPGPKVKKVDSLEYETFKVKSSSGKGSYAVRKFNNGTWTCSCPSYGFRRRCKHIETIKTKTH